MSCPIVIVTEYPGKTDLVTGKLLSGETGHLFWDLWFNEVGFTSAPPVLSVISKRPGSGKIEDFCLSKKGAQEEALALGLPGYSWDSVKQGKYLHPRFQADLDQLRTKLLELQPNLVVCLGSLACWALLGSAKISKLRGTCAESSLVPGLKVLPTYHPQTIMREWEQRVIAGADLMKAKRECQSPELIRPAREVWVVQDRKDLDWASGFLCAKSLLSLDIETKLGQITCLSFAVSPALSIVFPFTDSRQADWNFWREAEDEVYAWQVVKKICQTASIHKILQNGVYDIQYLWRVCNIKTLGFRHDTMIEHHCLYSELPKSLGFMGSIYTNEQSWKLMRRWTEKDIK
mgnify:FL=1|jgi:uracil-DNA glycosylase